MQDIILELYKNKKGYFFDLINLEDNKYIRLMGIGDWGLGIGSYLYT